MKSATKVASATYQSPESRIINIDIQALVCASLTGLDNEQYGSGDTSGWFGN